MARDRNIYVWQAYVTVMSIVSVVCIGAMAYVLFQSGTNSKTVEGALEREQKASAQLREESNKRQLLESMIGVGKQLTESERSQMMTSITADPQLNEAINAYNQNMSLFGKNDTAAKNYASLTTLLLQELRARNIQIDAASKREIEDRERYTNTIDQETKARLAEQQRAQELSNQLEKELTKYAENIKAQQETITKIENDKQTLVKGLENKNRAQTVKLDKLQKENEELTRRVDSLVRKLDEIQGEDFQYVQGKIIGVQRGGEEVWINLGKADGLRPGVSFGVLDADITRVSEARPKAKIEVVAVISESEHLSRCRVLPDRVPTTILNGDSIYSPAWQPGRKVQFALIGKMDIDNDGKDDREMLKSLIQQNGGEVTAELPPGANKLIGEISVNTRWLVIGDDATPKGTELEPSVQAATKRRSEIESQAKSLGVSRINLDKLLGWLRGSGVSEVSPIGSALRATPDQYRTRSPQVNSGRVSELYQSQDGSMSRTAPVE